MWKQADLTAATSEVASLKEQLQDHQAQENSWQACHDSLTICSGHCLYVNSLAYQANVVSRAANVTGTRPEAFSAGISAGMQGMHGTRISVALCISRCSLRGSAHRGLSWS